MLALACGDDAASVSDTSSSGNETTSSIGTTSSTADATTDDESSSTAVATTTTADPDGSSSGGETSTSDVHESSSTTADSEGASSESTTTNDPATDGSTTETDASTTGTTGTSDESTSTGTDDGATTGTTDASTSAASSDDGTTGETDGTTTTGPDPVTTESSSSSDDGGGPCPGDGAYVSQDTCVPAEQCGTIERPWCTITAGLNSSATSPVMVAASIDAYPGFTMVDGIDVEGGYEPTFSEARNPDPFTNGTRLQSLATVVQWPSNVDARLDGFAIATDRYAMNPPAAVNAVQVSAFANATLANVRVYPSSALSYASQTAGVQVIVGGGGSLVIEGLTTIDAPRAATHSRGVRVDATASLQSFVIDGATIRGGVASNGVGVLHEGFGLLSISNADIQAGPATTTSRGLVVGRAGHEGTELTDTSVHGGAATTATAVDHATSDHLFIHGGMIRGGGLSNVNARVIGVSADGVDELVIDGASITASTLVASPYAASAIGVELVDDGAVGTTGATILDATIDGGAWATTTTGVSTDGISIEIAGSTIHGSALNGGPTSIGVDIRGGFAVDAVIDVHDNVLLSGGAPVPGNGGGGTGVRIDTTTPVNVAGNTEVLGCSSPCSGVADGVLVADGIDHTIVENIEIRGGPGTNLVNEHTGVNVDEAGAVISDNLRIVGNDDPLNRPRFAYGIFARASTITVERNLEIMGGHAREVGGGSRAATGLRTWAPNADELTLATIRDNVVIGGTTLGSVQGLYLTGNQIVTVERNVVHTCPFPGDDVRCDANDAAALVTFGDEGSLFANNFFFGGFAEGSYACMVGCFLQFGDICFQNTDQDMRFEMNLCYVEGRASEPGVSSQATALWIDQFSDDDGDQYYASNIFYASPTAGRSFAVDIGTTDEFTLYNNDLIGDTCLLHDDNDNCAETIDDLHALDGNGLVTAQGNVSIEPAFADFQPLTPTADGFHLDGTCALLDLGIASPIVLEDYDGELRDDGVDGLPEPGPDECP